MRQELDGGVNGHHARGGGVGVDGAVVHAASLDQGEGIGFGIDANDDGLRRILASRLQGGQGAVGTGIIDAGDHVDIGVGLESIFHGGLPEIGGATLVAPDDDGIGSGLLQAGFDVIGADNHIWQIGVIQDGDIGSATQEGVDRLAGELAVGAAQVGILNADADAVDGAVTPGGLDDEHAGIRGSLQGRLDHGRVEDADHDDLGSSGNEVLDGRDLLFGLGLWVEDLGGDAQVRGAGFGRIGHRGMVLGAHGAGDDADLAGGAQSCLGRGYFSIRGDQIGGGAQLVGEQGGRGRRRHFGGNQGWGHRGGGHRRGYGCSRGGRRAGDQDGRQHEQSSNLFHYSLLSRYEPDGMGELSLVQFDSRLLRSQLG
jgi:hypothetical protein